jgi:hypothetical protein
MSVRNNLVKVSLLGVILASVLAVGYTTNLTYRLAIDDPTVDLPFSLTRRQVVPTAWFATALTVLAGALAFAELNQPNKS